MKRHLCLLIALMGCSILFAQTQQERLTHHVYYLASDSLCGREAGTVHAQKAASYIVQQFEEIGLQPFFEDGWYQPFEKYGTTTYRNVVGLIPGNDPVLKDEYIIIGAHYDHLGIRNEKVYNGADDNASGTATIIEMARILKQQQNTLKRSIIVVAFDAEEKGLWGSYDFSKKIDVSKVKLMMSIDMVGWLEKGKSLQLNGAATIKNGKRLLKDEAKKTHITVSPKNFETSLFGATDTQGFAEKGVATLHVTTGLKSPYHQPEDDAELIDYPGLDLVTDYLADVTLHCANDPSFAPSGKISPIHGGKKSVIEIGPSVSLVNANITFPKAGFNGKNQYGVDAGLMAEVHLGSHFSLQTGALYELLRAKYPDENDLFNTYLPYRQQSVLVPVNLLLEFGSSGLDFRLGFGGYYGHLLSTDLKGMPGVQIDPNQWGLSWSLGFQFGKVNLTGSRRYQLNPMFSGTDMPQAKIHSGILTIGYYF